MARVEFVGGPLDGEVFNSPGKPHEKWVTKRPTSTLLLPPDRTSYYATYRLAQGSHGIPWHYVHAGWIYTGEHR